MSLRLAAAFPAYVCMYTVCYLMAYLLRFDLNLPESVFTDRYLASLPVVLFVKVAACFGTREWQRRFRYTSFTDMVYVSIGAFGCALTLFLLNALGCTGGVIPRSVILIDAGLAILATGLLRSAVRLSLETVTRSGVKKINTLIYGADEAAISILRATQSGSSEYRIVGFVEEHSIRHQSMIGGVPVVGANRRLDLIARRFNASHVLLPGTMPGSMVREILEICQDGGLTAHVIPAVNEIVDGRFRLSVREVTISDLLRREPTELDMDGIRGYIRGRCVLVSGGAGSIGSELCRQILELEPSELIVVDQSEFGVFSIEQEFVKRSLENTELRFAVRDIGDVESMSLLMRETRPDIVFHAAAYKHVPLMESNPQEAIRNNIFGTRAMVDLADRFGVERFVLISTDKAVRPTNIMGCTKLIGEKYLQAVSARSKTQYITVRFGNVLNSVGSVVPTFRRQIEEGGPITVTDPDMERFFMTIPEAVQLVMQAGSVGTTGDILILDMGEPVRILDLSKDMIKLSGLRCPEDIDITFTGMRPGEKMYEELFYGSEEGSKKVHDKIFCAPRHAVDMTRMRMVLKQLADATEAPNREAIRILKSIVAEYVDVDSQPLTELKSAA
jgi:FlaA1/EpsC-like NDP-sugar epimerase